MAKCWNWISPLFCNFQLRYSTNFVELQNQKYLRWANFSAQCATQLKTLLRTTWIAILKLSAVRVTTSTGSPHVCRKGLDRLILDAQGEKCAMSVPHLYNTLLYRHTFFSDARQPILRARWRKRPGSARVTPLWVVWLIRNNLWGSELHLPALGRLHSLLSKQTQFTTTDVNGPYVQNREGRRIK